MRPRIFLDTETDHLPPGQRPWEIALLQEVEDDIVEEIVLVVEDVDLTDADPESLAMNGFHDRHPLGDRWKGRDPEVFYLPEGQVARYLVAHLRKAEIVAAQPAFDMEGIAALLRRHDYAPSWHYRLRCIESETAGFLRRDVGGLQDCAKQLGVPVDPAAVHSAIGDARLVYNCWEQIFRRDASERG